MRKRKTQNSPVMKEEDKEFLRRLAKDAARWRKLIKLVGTPADGSDTPVRLFWDDATMTPFISVKGMKRTDYYVERGSFEQVIDSIPEPED